MNRDRHPITGCRPSTLWGVWAILEESKDDMEARAYVEIDAGRLPLVAAESKKQIEERSGEGLYSVEDGIAVISIEGPITKYDTSFASIFGGTSTVRTQQALRAAVRDPDVQTILIDADSPGGTVLGIAELSDAISKADKLKPVIAHVSGAACSGCLWAILGARAIIADPTAEIGSIGAFTVLTDRTENMKRQGIEKDVVSSGELKGAGAGGTKVNKVQRAHIQERIDTVAKTFIQHVAASRGMSVEDARKVAAGGKVYGAEQAMKLGLIDGISLSDDLMEDLKSKRIPSPAPRGPGNQREKTSAASKRSTAMALTAEQLKQVRDLPGAANVTEENAPQFVIDAAIKATSDLATARTQIQAKDQELVALKAKGPGAPTLPSAGELYYAARAVSSERERVIASGAITPAVADALQAKFLGGVDLKAMTLDRATSVDDVRVAAGIGNLLFAFESLQGNKPAPKLGKVTAIEREAIDGDQGEREKEAAELRKQTAEKNKPRV